jgi:hypothetical protein
LNIVFQSVDDARVARLRLMERFELGASDLSSNLTDALGWRQGRALGAAAVGGNATEWNATAWNATAWNATAWNATAWNATSVGSNATTNMLLISPSADSLVLVELTLTRSFYGIFLDWLLRNILNVLIGAGLATAFILFIAGYRKFSDRRKEARARLKALVAAGNLARLRIILRLNIYKAKFRRLLRRVHPFISLLQWVRGGGEDKWLEKGAHEEGGREEEVGEPLRIVQSNGDSVEAAGVEAAQGVTARVEAAAAVIAKVHVVETAAADERRSGAAAAAQMAAQVAAPLTTAAPTALFSVETIVDEGGPKPARQRGLHALRAAAKASIAMRPRVDGVVPLDEFRERVRAIQRRVQMDAAGNN